MMSRLMEQVGSTPESILGIACGTAVELGPLWKDSKYYGFDLIPEMVKQADANLVAQGKEAKLWQGDLLQPGLNSPFEIEKGIELAIFHGNSLGHFTPDQYRAVFKNVFETLKDEGQFFFNFRDGNLYFDEVRNGPVLEPLGSGLLEDGSQFWSAYERYQCQDINEPYHAQGIFNVVTPDGQRKPSSHFVTGNFVIPDLALETCQEAGFSTVVEVTKGLGSSLNHLRSFVASK